MFEHFPPVLRRAGVSKMAFKSLVVFRAGVRGLGVESAGRRSNIGERRIAFPHPRRQGNSVSIADRYQT